MKLIKRQFKPILFVGGILLFNMLLWYIYLSNAHIALEPMLTAIMGSSLLMAFMMVFFLSTRNKVVVRVFDDLGNLYTWHRAIAITTTLLIFVHGFFATAKGVMNIPDVFLLGNALNAGETARNIFVGLILLALCAKLFQYEHFRYLHRLLIIPYIFALYHGFYTSIADLFSFSYLSIWMWFTLVVGICSYIYIVFIYQRTAFKHVGKLIEKVILNDAIYELKIKMNNVYLLKPGQYAFIKIYAKGLSKEPHPFSISKIDGKYVYFTVKALGDYTLKLLKELSPPATLKITNPFGTMTFDNNNKKQVWLAGGIGITPFLGCLRTSKSIQKHIHMIYSVRHLREAIHLNELKQLDNEIKDFSFSLFDTSKQGFITADDLGIDHLTTLYMCGPRSMVLAIQKQMKDKYPNTEIIHEAFSFTGTLLEDIITFVKKAINRFKKKK